MKVSELIEKLKTVDPDSEVYIRYLRGDAYGGAEVEDYWLDDIEKVYTEDRTVVDWCIERFVIDLIIDISDDRP